LTGVRTTVFHRLAELLDLKIGDAAPGKADILTVVRPLCRTPEPIEGRQAPIVDILTVVRPLCRFVSGLNDYARRTPARKPRGAADPGALDDGHAARQARF
jgi:hypothetical protein